MSKKIKRGRINNYEKKRIEDLLLLNNKSVKEVADLLGRAPIEIKTFAEREYDYKEKVEHLNEYSQILKDLRNTNEYKSLRRFYTLEEVKQYEDLYVKLILQFGQDLPIAEQLQVHRLSGQSIQVARSVKTLFSLHNLVQEYMSELETEKVNNGNQARIRELEGIINQYNDSISRQIASNDKLRKEEQNLLQSLNATRIQRTKDIENFSKTERLIDLVKLLRDKENQRREGNTARLAKIADAKAKNQMSQPHIYHNKETDLPLLTTETAHNLEWISNDEDEIIDAVAVEITPNAPTVKETPNASKALQKLKKQSDKMAQKEQKLREQFPEYDSYIESQNSKTDPQV